MADSWSVLTPDSELNWLCRVVRAVLVVLAVELAADAAVGAAVVNAFFDAPVDARGEKSQVYKNKMTFNAFFNKVSFLYEYRADPELLELAKAMYAARTRASSAKKLGKAFVPWKALPRDVSLAGTGGRGACTADHEALMTGDMWHLIAHVAAHIGIKTTDVAGANYKKIKKLIGL